MSDEAKQLNTFSCHVFYKSILQANEDILCDKILQIFWQNTFLFMFIILLGVILNSSNVEHVVKEATFKR